MRDYEIGMTLQGGRVIPRKPIAQIPTDELWVHLDNIAKGNHYLAPSQIPNIVERIRIELDARAWGLC